MLGRSIAALRRLGEFLGNFETCFRHPAQRGAVSRYLDGLLGSSPKKQITRMWERLENPGQYQSLQHFVTTSTWDTAHVWTALRRTIPDRRGILIADDTGIPKQGSHSVGVQRQYSGTLGKVGNCQIAVSSVLQAGASTWLVAMDLYLPESWAKNHLRRQRAGIPPEVEFRPKWQIALAQLDTLRREDFQIECVLADAGYGDITEYRKELSERSLPYVLGVGGKMSAWTKEPRMVKPKKHPRGRPRPRRVAYNCKRPDSLHHIAKKLVPEAWRIVSWRGITGKCRQGRFAALRIIPAHAWKEGEVHAEVWLLIEKRANETKFYVSNMPPATTIEKLVELTKMRCAIEKNYREIKDDIGFDHFMGRRYQGWNHHAVLTGIAYAFLERERRRGKKKTERISFQAARHFIYRVFVAMEVAADDELYAVVSDFRAKPPTRRWF